MENQFHVKDGDKIMCTLGSCDSTLGVLVSHGIRIQGRNGATVKDCEAIVNIRTFGNCCKTTPPEPCCPVILNEWLMGDKSFEMNGEISLLNTSILSCARGGIITIKR